MSSAVAFLVADHDTWNSHGKSFAGAVSVVVLVIGALAAVPDAARRIEARNEVVSQTRINVISAGNAASLLKSFTHRCPATPIVVLTDLTVVPTESWHATVIPIREVVTLATGGSLQSPEYPHRYNWLSVPMTLLAPEVITSETAPEMTLKQSTHLVLATRRWATSESPLASFVGVQPSGTDWSVADMRFTTASRRSNLIILERDSC